MKFLYLALGLAISTHAFAASVSGSIGIRLTIAAAPCLVVNDITRGTIATCYARPTISYQEIAQSRGTVRVTTVEW